MNSFSALLNSLSPDNLKRGKQFELACKWFLENDRRYSSLIEKVWLWDDWPDRWGPDCGIDLVARGKDGKTWAIQAKCYAPDHSVNKRDIDSFLSESTDDCIDLRLIVASTNNIGKNARRVIARQNNSNPVREVLLQDLMAAGLVWPANIDQLMSGFKQKQIRYTPRPHQNKAIKDVKSKLHKRGQLIMACGTGKTLTSLWIAEALNSERVLVLLPSLLLLSKTLQEWVSNAKESIPFLPVCSDQTVSRGADEVLTSTSELAFPTTTDPKEIATFLDRPGKKIIFSTYQSSPRIAEAFQQSKFQDFDLVVADEAHRCTGKVSAEFATILNDELIPSDKKLFMTATPRVYTSRLRKKTADSGVDILSMDDETVFGPVLHHLTFGQAISRNLLTDYQVVVVGVDSPTYKCLVDNRKIVETDSGIKSDARMLASHVGLVESIVKYNLRRVITFHSRVAWANKFARELPKVIDWMPNDLRPKLEISSNFISGDMTTGERNNRLNALGEVTRGKGYVLANARCLGEGIDIPSLDGIAFIDPKKSEIDIVQAVGRAIRLSDDKTVGTIVIPVFIESGDDPETTLSGSEFDKVWQVVNALRAHDEHLGVQLDTFRMELGRSGSSNRSDKIIFDLPTKIDKRFVSAFNTRLIEATTTTWNFWFGLLVAYAEENGHTKVPHYYKTSDGYRLGRWVSVQREKREPLSAKRIRRLEALPEWTWNVFTSRWEEGYTYLLEFVRFQGHARVPKSFITPEGHNLGRWVSRQRAKKDTLKKQRLKQLEALPGWVWNTKSLPAETHDTKTSRWKKGYAHLLNFVEQKGHARVPSQYTSSDGFLLGLWVGQQKKNRNTLDKKFIDRLEKLPDWVWDMNVFQWEEGFAQLLDFVQLEGHARVPGQYTTTAGFSLGRWVSQQRKSKSKNTLDKELIVQLEELPGWAWDVKTFQWEEGYAHLLDFVEHEGHARVPQHYQTSNFYNLGQWVSDQRKYRDKINKERRTRLESLDGWIWDRFSYVWEEGYSQLKMFAEREGHTRVPRGYLTTDSFNLGHWVSEQRKNRDKINRERRTRLESLDGWVWEVLDFQWEEAFAHLLNFIKHEGHARVPLHHKSSDGFRLGAWVSQQRVKKNRLTNERRTRLESLDGWIWNTHTFQWEKGYAHLLDFVKHEGHARVPNQHKTADSFGLGAWASRQRVKKNRLTKERIARLEKLTGWIWSVGKGK